MLSEGIVSATQLVSWRQAEEVASLPQQPLLVLKSPPLPAEGLLCMSFVP